jgi:hypothetical protein
MKNRMESLNALGLGSGPDGLGGCLRFNGLQGLVYHLKEMKKNRHMMYSVSLLI